MIDHRIQNFIESYDWEGLYKTWKTLDDAAIERNELHDARRWLLVTLRTIVLEKR